MHTRRALDERLRHHFDQLRCALVVCDAQARVQWLNRSAQVLLSEAGSLQLTDTCLRGRAPSDTESLLREISAAATDDSGQVHYLSLGTGSAALHVAAQAINLSKPQGVGMPTVMLVITPVRSVGNIPASALAKLFGLTPTEAKLLGAMVTGSTVEEYAQHREISVGTARGQLKQVQSKTGARRQSELVRLVLTSAAAQLLATGH